MRTKEQILDELANIGNVDRTKYLFMQDLIEVLIDLRTNLKEISEQLRLLRVEPNES